MLNVLPPVVQLKRIALDLLFPSYCINCGREGDFICSNCRRLMPFIESPVCHVCGHPVTDESACYNCNDRQFEIDGIRSPFAFEGVVQQAVYKLKYQNIRALAKPLAELLSDYLNINSLPGDTLVPVPLHKKRLRERGYNQSNLVAHELGKLCDLPVIDDCLIRCLYTPPQARAASLDERRQNIKGAFTCLDNRLQGRQVLLLDDVATSGSTLDACARELKASGAISAWGLTIALEL